LSFIVSDVFNYRFSFRSKLWQRLTQKESLPKVSLTLLLKKQEKVLKLNTTHILQHSLQIEFYIFNKLSELKKIDSHFFEILHSNVKNFFPGEEFVERRGPSPLSVKAEPDLGPILKKLLHLHLLSRLEEDLAYFITAELLTPEQAQKVINRFKLSSLSFRF
jgi:hypothetical protein